MTVCAHAANNLTKATQTVCTLVTKIGKENIYTYTTGASNPCLSPFFPIFAPNTKLPQGYLKGDENFNPDVFWWKAEKHHRKAALNYRDSKELLDKKMDDYENKMLEFVENRNIELTQQQIDQYFSVVEDLYTKWGDKISTMPNMKGKIFFKNFWQKYNKLNGIN